jgi:hypothetical protein
MTTIAVLAAAAILLYTHRHALRNERQAWETRLDAQEHRHNAHFAAVLKAQAQERTVAKSIADNLLAEMRSARTEAAEERVQLMNRVKPESYQPPLSQPDTTINPPAAAFDDDDAFWDARESRDEMVARIEREMKTARVTA